MKVTFKRSRAKLMVLEYCPKKGPGTELTVLKRLKGVSVELGD